MRIIRFLSEEAAPVLAVWTDDEKIYTLPFQDFTELIHVAESQKKKPLQIIEESIRSAQPLIKKVEQLHLLVPVVAPEVWACGVTYEKSREARNYEATGGKLDASTFYDKVYNAERPEIFFKSTAARTIGPNDKVYLRDDSVWQIPEPELALVLSSDGTIVGYTIGNDMSCRDIEGENPLYLPQAKIWKNACSIGPAIRLAETVKDPYQFVISCRIYRGGEKVFEGSANTKQLKRKFEELVSYLLRNNEIYEGSVLFTGTCIVPPNDFTLEPGDRIDIEISDIGILSNTAAAFE